MALDSTLPVGFQEPIDATPTGMESVPSPEEARTVQTTTVDLPTLAAEDVAAQRGTSRSAQDLSNEFRSIMNSKSYDEIAASGVEIIGDEVLTPSRIQEINADPGLYGALEYEYITNKSTPQQDPAKPAVPFSTPDYTEVRLPEWTDDYSADFKSILTDAVKNRQKVAALISETNPNLTRRGQDLILSQFKTGDTLTEFLRAGEDLPGELARLPLIVGMATSAAGALKDAAGEAMFGDRDFDNTFIESFGKRMGQKGWMREYDRALNDTVVLDSSRASLKREYKKKFIAEYGEDAWREDHQVPLIEVVDGKAQYKLDENGNVEYRDVGLDDASADGILELAYKELPASSKAALYFSEQAPFTAVGTVIAVSRASKTVGAVQNARKSNTIKYADKTDYEVYQSLRAEKSSGFLAPLKGAFNFATAGNVRARGRLTMGEQLTSHRATISRYEDDITAINKRLDDPNLDDVKRIELGKQRDVLKTSLRSYQLRKGTGTINSPYIRSVARDDVLISTAVGLGAAALPTDFTAFGVDGDTIVGITAPIFAPAVSRLAVWGGSKAINTITDNTIKDVGLMLENSDFLPFITQGTLVKGDEAKMRSVMTEMGRAVTDQDVAAFTQLNRLFNQMTPEYREKAYQSLLDYNKMINGFRDDMFAVGMSDEAIAEALPTLHLTVAQATGIAPLLAFQKTAVQDLNAANLTKKMPEIMETIGAEEATLEGMTTNLNLLKDLIRKNSGVDLDSNVGLQQLMNDTAESIAFQQGNLNKKKQEMYLALQSYVENVGVTEGIDTDTIDKLVELETILDTGEVAGIITRGERVVKMHNRIIKSAEEELQAIKDLSSDMDTNTFTKEFRRVADIMFDAEYGRRKALASAEYRKVDDMVGEDTLDMTDVMRRLVDMTEDMKDKPLSVVFGGMKGFFNKAGGKDLHNAMRTMARRGLLAEFGEDTITALITQRREVDGLENFGYIDLALELAENSAEPLQFFAAKPSEVENVYRYFRDRAITLSRQSKTPSRLEADIAQEFKDTIDEVYSNYDPAVRQQITKARQTYQDNVGNRVDKGRYAQVVRDGRERKRPADESRSYYYPDENKAPEAPFVKIANLAVKITEEADPAESLQAIAKERDRIMYLLGGTKGADGRLVFDFRDPVQKRNAYMAQQMLETMISKKISDKMARDADLSIEILNEGMDVANKKITYNFSKAMRIVDIENELRVGYIDEQGVFQSAGGVELDVIKNRAASWDKIMKTNKDAQVEYEAIRKRVDVTSGVLGIAQKKELDAINETIGQLSQNTKLINNPKAFYSEFFENATPESYNNTIAEFVAQSGGKLTEDQVRTSMKYMYLRGIFERGGVQTGLDAPSGRLRGDVTKINTFIDDISDPRRAAVMEAVLGTDHVDQLQRIARWSSYSMGDALDFRAGRATKGMSLDSVFSRVFNIARGMVSPLYVGTEAATRMMLENKQNLINLALSDRQAAEFMANVLTNPERLTELDIKTFSLRVQNYLARGAAEGAVKIPSVQERYGITEENNDETVQ